MRTIVCTMIAAALTLAGCTTIPVTGTSAVQANPETSSPKAGQFVKSFVVPEGAGTQAILACPSKRIEYTPIPALPAGGYTDIQVDANHRAKVVLMEWPRAPEDVNKLLTNIATDITESSLDVSGGVGGIVSGSHSIKQYVIDFMKWRAEPLTSTDNTPLGWVRVGAGLRVVINITKDDGSATGSLLALAVGVRAGKVDGSISTELVGMDAKEVTQAMPFTVDLSEGNIQKVVETLAVVKTKLYDSTTTIRPNLIARIECAPLGPK